LSLPTGEKKGRRVEWGGPKRFHCTKKGKVHDKRRENRILFLGRVRAPQDGVGGDRQESSVSIGVKRKCTNFKRGPEEGKNAPSIGETALRKVDGTGADLGDIHWEGQPQRKWRRKRSEWEKEPRKS